MDIRFYDPVSEWRNTLVFFLLILAMFALMYILARVRPTVWPRGKLRSILLFLGASLLVGIDLYLMPVPPWALVAFAMTASSITLVVGALKRRREKDEGKRG